MLKIYKLCLLMALISGRRWKSLICKICFIFATAAHTHDYITN